MTEEELDIVQTFAIDGMLAAIGAIEHDQPDMALRWLKQDLDILRNHFDPDYESPDPEPTQG